MRVTFVTSGLETGGAEFALLRLLPALREQDVEPSVVSLKSMGTVGPLLRARSVPVVALGMPAPAPVFLGLVTLSRLVRESGSSLIHGWMYHGNLAASAVAWRTQLPVVWGIRQSLGLGTRDKWLTRRMIEVGAMLSNHAARIVYNSAAAREQHERRGYASASGVVIPNGFETDCLKADDDLRVAVRRELGVDQIAPVIAQVARFHPAKDFPTFLRAAAMTRARHPEAVFVLVGEGVEPSNPELARLIASLGLADSTRLLGRRDDVTRLMAAFDLLCLTSSSEGFPNVIGEAMSCGVPCVGTAVGDVTELIGDTGEVVPPSDPEAVAAAIHRIVSLPGEAKRALGARARQRIVNRFAISEVARRYAQLLRAVAGIGS